MARRGASGDPKVAALREARCLNPHPEAVTDEAFGSQEFFDARDAVQVKYEMVRRVRVADPSLRAADLVEPIDARFGVRVHPRSIERALARFREVHSKSR